MPPQASDVCSVRTSLNPGRSLKGRESEGTPSKARKKLSCVPRKPHLERPDILHRRAQKEAGEAPGQAAITAKCASAHRGDPKVAWDVRPPTLPGVAGGGCGLCQDSAAQGGENGFVAVRCVRLGQRLGVRGQGTPPHLLLGSTALPEASPTTGDARVLGKGQGCRGSPSAD